MKILKNWQDEKGRFKKGVASWTKGKKLTIEHKEKLRQAKLKRPVRYWLGKKRKIAKLPKLRKDGYKYIGFSLIEEELQTFFEKWFPRPVPEHHYIWVKHNKTKVPKGYHIHHINENKIDNRIKNLRLMISGEHSRLHNLGKNHTKETKNLMSKLPVIIAGMLVSNKYFCLYCQKQIKGFRDILSAKEYEVSGLCQKCQDRTFKNEKKRN